MVNFSIDKYTERTRPFNESDISYFRPLMQDTEARLGRRPRFGAMDTAYDAHYVYDYFHPQGFAAVPRNDKPHQSARTFADDGAPVCAAGLAMHRQFAYTSRSGLEPQQKERFRCPLHHPTATGDPCPITDPHMARGGCKTDIAAGPGSRIRWQLDRKSEHYLAIFNQRTVCERINSQALDLGIERPKLRNQRSIRNQNTLIYVLINLRTAQRIAARLAAQAARTEVGPDTSDTTLTA